MININHLVKVTMAWVSVVYVICYAGVALIPQVRPWFMMYALHTNLGVGVNALSLVTFISGLVIWNAVAVIAVWLFAALFNAIKQ